MWVSLFSERSREREFTREREREHENGVHREFTRSLSGRDTGVGVDVAVAHSVGVVAGNVHRKFFYC